MQARGVSQLLLVALRNFFLSHSVVLALTLASAACRVGHHVVLRVGQCNLLGSWHDLFGTTDILNL